MSKINYSIFFNTPADGRPFTESITFKSDPENSKKCVCSVPHLGSWLLVRSNAKPCSFWIILPSNKNKDAFFFHTMDEYIYIEFPEFKMAMFYFFKKEFESNYEAEKEAKQIIGSQYGRTDKVNL